MNKLTKLLSVFVIAGAVGTGVSFAAGCGHRHSFSEDWSSDGKSHWHAATCEHSDEKADLADHKDEDKNLLCDECGYDLATHVTKVTLNTTSKTLKIGEEFQLEATVLPANASIKTYSWKSSDTKVAEVANGKVTAKAAGTATITVTTTDGSKTEQCTITVEDNTPATVAVTGITLDKTELPLKVGETEQIKATIAPENATNKKRTRTSSDETVATIDSNGVVTAVGVGTATITVKTEDGGFEAKCTVTVTSATVAVTGVTLDKTELKLKVGETEQIKATIAPENATNKKRTRTSSDETVATIDSNGVVTAVGVGTATITVKTEDGGYEAKCTVTVTSATVPVTGVSLKRETLELEVGDTDEFVATVLPATATNKKVTFTSSDPTVATMDGDTITALKVGTTTITVTTADGNFTATCVVTVKEKTSQTVPVTGITLDKTELPLKVGETDKITATITPANASNKKRTRVSSNPGVATIDSDGTVTAVGVGTAVITVKTEDGGYEATCTVTVTSATVAVTGVTLDKTELPLKVGETGELVATVLPATATNKKFTFTSSDPSVASIEGDTVTALKVGTTVITVTTADGEYTAQCTVTVTSATVAVTGVTLDKTELPLKVGETGELVATVLPANATNKKFTFTSSDPSVASIEGDTVTALKVGTTVITVTTADGEYTAQCTVTVTGNQVTPPNPETAKIELGTNKLALKKGETAEVELKLDSSYVGKKLYIFSYDEVELTVTGSTAAGSGVLVTYAAGLKVSVKYTGEEDGEAGVYVCPVLAMGENTVTAAVGTNLFAVIADELTEVNATVQGDTDGTVGFRSKFDTELATETTAFVENGIAVISLMNNGESSKTVTLNVAEPEEEEPEFNGTEIALDEATDFTADGFGYSLFKVELTAGSYTLNFTGCNTADLDIVVGLSFNEYDEVEDTIEAEGGVYTLAEGATVYIGLIISLDADPTIEVITGKLTVSEAGETKMSEADFKAAINATLAATNYSVFLNVDDTTQIPYVKADGESNTMYALMDGDAYIVYDTESKKASMYSLLHEGSDIMIKSPEEIPCDSFADLLEMLMYSDNFGLAASLKTLGTITAAQYEEVTFDSKTGEYTCGDVTVTFANGKVATFIDTESPTHMLMSFTDYGETSVELPSGNIFENVVFRKYARNDSENPEKLGKLDDSINCGLYAQDNSATNYVAATDKGFVQNIDSNQKIYISFALLKDNIEGYFELSADAFGSSWNLMQFTDTAGKPLFTMASGSEKEGKFTFLNGATAVEGKSVQLTVNKMSKFAYAIKKVEGNYKLTLTIDGNNIVTDADLGAKAVSNITLVSSSGGKRKLTIDNVIICGEKMTADEYRPIAQAKIDALYNKMAVGKAAVGTEGEEGYVPAVPATHSMNADNITTVYNNRTDLSLINDIDLLAQQVEIFINQMAQFDSDAEIKEARAAALTKLDEFKAAKENEYTINSVAFNEKFTQAAAQIATATSVKAIEDYADTEKLLQGILTDAQENQSAKERALATLKSTFNEYKATIEGRLTEVSEAKLATVLADIEAAWATAKTAVNNADSQDDVNTAMATFDSAVDTAIANASDSIAAKKTAAANQLAIDTDKAIKDAGLDKNDQEIHELLYSEILEGENLPHGLVPKWQAKITADDVTDETTLANLVAQATFEIYKAYAPLQLQAEFDKAKAAVDKAQSEEIANGYKLFEIATGNSEFSEARRYITDRSGAIYGYENTIKDAQETISSPETTDKAKIDELMETIIGKLTSMSDTAVSEITAKIAEIKEFTFKVTIEGVEGITADDVKIGESVVLKGSEPDDVMIKAWYWYVPVLNSPTGEMKTELYDFKAPVFDNITIHATTAEAIKTNINNAFKHSAIPTKTVDKTVLTQDDFTGDNSFLTVNGNNVTWRNGKSFIENKDGGLSFYYAGGGVVTVTIGFGSTGDENESRVGLKDPEGNYIKATSDGGTTLVKDGDEAGSYQTKGGSEKTLTFTITEKGTYVIDCPSVQLNRGARIFNVKLVGYSKEEVVAVTDVTIGLKEGEWTENKTYDVSDVDTIELTATLTPAEPTYTTVTWTSSDETVATVEDGVVTLIKKGTVTITATAHKGKKDEVTITVTDTVLDAAIAEAKAALATLKATIAAVNVNEIENATAKAGVEAAIAEANTSIQALEAKEEQGEMYTASEVQAISDKYTTAYNNAMAVAGGLSSVKEANIEALEAFADAKKEAYDSIADDIDEAVESGIEAINGVTDAQYEQDDQIVLTKLGEAKAAIYRLMLGVDLEELDEDTQNTECNNDIRDIIDTAKNNSTITTDSAYEEAVNSVQTAINGRKATLATTPITVSVEDGEGNAITTLSVTYNNKLKLSDVFVVAKEVTSATIDGDALTEDGVVIYDETVVVVELEDIANFEGNIAWRPTAGAAASNKFEENCLFTLGNAGNKTYESASVSGRVIGNITFNSSTSIDAPKDGGTNESTPFVVTVNYELATLKVYLSLCDSTGTGNNRYGAIYCVTGEGEPVEIKKLTASGDMSVAYSVENVKKDTVLKFYAVNNSGSGGRLHLYGIDAAVDEAKVAKEVSITWNAGETPVAETYRYYEVVNLPKNNPTDGTKTFLGWYYTPEGGSETKYEGGQKFPSGTSITFTPKFLNDNVTLVFEVDGEKVAEEKFALDTGDKGVDYQTGEASKANYYFLGWTVKDGDGTVFDFAEVTPNEDISVMKTITLVPIFKVHETITSVQDVVEVKSAKFYEYTAASTKPSMNANDTLDGFLTIVQINNVSWKKSGSELGLSIKNSVFKIVTDKTVTLNIAYYSPNNSRKLKVEEMNVGEDGAVTDVKRIVLEEQAPTTGNGWTKNADRVDANGTQLTHKDLELTAGTYYITFDNVGEHKLNSISISSSTQTEINGVVQKLEASVVEDATVVKAVMLYNNEEYTVTLTAAQYTVLEEDGLIVYGSGKTAADAHKFNSCAIPE